MKYILKNLNDWSNIVYNEISNDHSEYWNPLSKEEIFNQGLMKFINGNINYYSLENIFVSTVFEEVNYNKNFLESLNFCNFVKDITDKKELPFGRMCIWNLQPNCQLLPHVDNFFYHSMIDRYIFIVSDHEKTDVDIIINDEAIDTTVGTLFEFDPYSEKHSFLNRSDKNFYFLGFDIWKKEIINKYSSIFTRPITENKYRKDTLGNLYSKYFSNH